MQATQKSCWFFPKTTGCHNIDCRFSHIIADNSALGYVLKRLERNQQQLLNSIEGLQRQISFTNQQSPSQAQPQYIPGVSSNTTRLNRLEHVLLQKGVIHKPYNDYNPSKYAPKYAPKPRKSRSKRHKHNRNSSSDEDDDNSCVSSGAVSGTVDAPTTLRSTQNSSSFLCNILPSRSPPRVPHQTMHNITSNKAYYAQKKKQKAQLKSRQKKVKMNRNPSSDDDNDSCVSSEAISGTVNAPITLRSTQKPSSSSRNISRNIPPSYSPPRSPRPPRKHSTPKQNLKPHESRVQKMLNRMLKCDKHTRNTTQLPPKHEVDITPRNTAATTANYTRMIEDIHAGRQLSQSTLNECKDDKYNDELDDTYDEMYNDESDDTYDKLNYGDPCLVSTYYGTVPDKYLLDPEEATMLFLSRTRAQLKSKREYHVLKKYSAFCRGYEEYDAPYPFEYVSHPLNLAYWIIRNENCKANEKELIQKCAKTLQHSKPIAKMNPTELRQTIDYIYHMISHDIP